MKSSVTYKVLEKIGKFTLSWFGKLIEFVDGKIIFLKPEGLLGLNELEKNYQNVLKELEAVLQAQKISGIEEIFKE
jgi:hypothetical protein